MTRPPSNRDFQAACLAVLLAFVHVSSAQSQETPESGTPESGTPESGTPESAAASIAESQIEALQEELAQHKTVASSTRMRRALKNTVRKAEALLEASPTAPNRFRVLAIVLQSQRRLLRLDNSDRNREALFDTCGKLAKAPDEYAEFRLEADLLLSDKALTLKNADIKERADALAEIVRRYRDTPAEVKSLMMAAMIAPKLEAFDLERELVKTMSERFPGDPVVIGWRRKTLGVTELDVLYTGTYKRADGVSLSFPLDAMGHTSLIYFWSKETPGIKERLAEVKALQTRSPGQLEVFSSNLDNLPDAGEKTLLAMGLDWTAMRLPGGRQSQAYRAYATRDPLGVRVNAHGHAFLHPPAISALAEDMLLGRDLDDARYLAQLQSLFIGDFLVVDADFENEPPPVAESVPTETLGAIQACFTAGPMRYRQTREQTLANYKKAEKLCRDAIKKYSKAPDLWLVRNRRIIALLGMWNLATEPKHLEAAAEEARTALGATPPRGADVVPRFCLAKETLRQGNSDPKSVLAALIKATGGTDAPALAYAAATILAMDANDRDLHAKYRQMLLETDADDPKIWPVASFLRDQNHTFRLFKANYYLPPSRARRVVRGALRHNAAALDAAADTSGPLKAEFKTLTGGKLSLPRATDGKLTLLMFVEPPADPGADFPTAINGAITEDSRGKQVEVPGVMQNAFQLADQHIHKRIKVIAAFLCDDVDRVKTLMEKNKWPCQAVMVPGGLKSPLARQLGILSADRIPNIVLLRGDGTIAWTLSGLVHPQLKSEGVGELKHVITLGLNANINLCEMEASLGALKKGKFQKAVQIFSGPFPPPERPYPNGWTAPRLHGRALAHKGLKNWEAALADIDAAVDAHHQVFNYGKPCACQREAKLLLTKATILDNLGKPQEAKAAKQLAAAATKTHSTSRYGSFHDQLNALNVKDGQ